MCYPEVPILALTIYDNDEKVFNALCAGASGYLLKNTPPVMPIEMAKAGPIDGLALI